jgi:hypothetical protein
VCVIGPAAAAGARDIIFMSPCAATSEATRGSAAKYCIMTKVCVVDVVLS